MILAELLRQEGSPIGCACRIGPDVGSTCPGNPQVRPAGKLCGSGVMDHGYPSLLTRAGTGIVSEFWVNPWVPMDILINLLDFNTNLIFFSLV